MPLYMLSSIQHQRKVCTCVKAKYSKAMETTGKHNGVCGAPHTLYLVLLTPENKIENMESSLEIMNLIKRKI